MPTNPGTANLVEWWPFNEVSGNRTGAHAGLVLTDVNTVGYSASGIQGNAADFESTAGEYLTRAGDTALTFSGAFTVGAWINAKSFPAGTFPGVVCKREGFTTFQWALLLDAGVTTFGVNIAAAYFRDAGGNLVFKNHSTVLSTATWYLLTMGWDGSSTAWIAVNDGARQTVALSGLLATGSEGVAVGALDTAGTFPFDGLIDEAFMFDDELTMDEIAWLYNSGTGRTYAELSGGSALPIIMQAHAAAGWR